MTKIDNNVKNMNIEGTAKLLARTTTFNNAVISINESIYNYKYILVYLLQAYGWCAAYYPTWLVKIISRQSFSCGKPSQGYGAQGNINISIGEGVFTVEISEAWKGG